MGTQPARQAARAPGAAAQGASPRVCMLGPHGCWLGRGCASRRRVGARLALAGKTWWGGGAATSAGKQLGRVATASRAAPRNCPDALPGRAGEGLHIAAQCWDGVALTPGAQCWRGSPAAAQH